MVTSSLIARRLLSTVALAAAVACILISRTASADPASDGKDLFARGRELRTRGDCAGAVGMFRKAYELYPEGLGSLRNLAECEESLGHFASSHRAWLDLKRALMTTPDKKYEGWDQDATEGATRLAPKLATLTIDLNVVGPAGEAQPARGLEVTLDGEKLALSLIGTPLERDPGSHVMKITGDRLQGPVERAVNLAAGDLRRVALRVVVTPDKPSEPGTPATTSPPSTTVPPDDDAERARTAKRSVGWAAIGLGAAGLVGAGISLGVRQSALSTLQGQCPGLSGCDPGLQSAADRGRAASTVFAVLGIVGVVGVGTGVVLLATSGHTQQARLVVTPTVGGASATWRF